MKSLMVVAAICAFLFMPEAVKAGQDEPQVAQLGQSPSVVKPVVGLIALTMVESLSNGLMAVRGGMGRHVKPSLTMRLAKEARDVIAEPGNGWMKPEVLLGLAVTESDLRGDLKAGYGTVADCGLTQVNVTTLRMSNSKKRSLCKRLRKSTKLSMQWTMKEMNTIKVRYCNDNWLAKIKRYSHRFRTMPADTRFWMCMLNVYNQGPRFVTQRYNLCDFEYRTSEDVSVAFQAKIKRRCVSRNKYWMRTLCFAEGIKRGKPPMYKKLRWSAGKRKAYYRRASCRQIYKPTQITGLYNY